MGKDGRWCEDIGSDKKSSLLMGRMLTFLTSIGYHKGAMTAVCELRQLKDLERFEVVPAHQEKELPPLGKGTLSFEGNW